MNALAKWNLLKLIKKIKKNSLFTKGEMKEWFLGDSCHIFSNFSVFASKPDLKNFGASKKI